MHMPIKGWVSIGSALVVVYGLGISTAGNIWVRQVLFHDVQEFRLEKLRAFDLEAGETTDSIPIRCEEGKIKEAGATCSEEAGSCLFTKLSFENYPNSRFEITVENTAGGTAVVRPFRVCASQ